MQNLPRFSTRQLPDAASAEGLLAGRGVAPEAPAGQQALACLLEIAAGPAIDWELAGEAAAVAAFARVTGLAGSRGAGAWPRTVPGFRGLARLSLALTACVTALGGAVAAAGALPAPIQDLAHITFGAPAPHHGVPVLRPVGGWSRQPGQQGIQPKGQPGLQQARVKSQTAHQDAAAKADQKVHGRARSNGQPCQQKSNPAGHPEVSHDHPGGR